MTPKKILFFTPNGGRGGSEMMLWYLTKELDKQKIDWKVITFGKGDLLNEKNYPGKVHLLPSKKGRKSEIISKINRNLFRYDLDDKFISKINRNFKPDIWYFNTIITIEKAYLAVNKNIKYAFHLHESLTVFDKIDKNTLSKAISNSYLNIGCSKKLSCNLEILGSKKTTTLFSGVDFSKIKIGIGKKEIRQKLQIHENDFVWYMSGIQSVTKGLDYFVKIAEKFKNYPNVKFVWVGRKRNTGYNLWCENYVLEKNLDNLFILNELSDDYFSHINAFDALLLTSREDSFPLVMLEAAYLSKPIVGFNSGGVAEFIKSKTGLIQEDLSITGIVAKMNSIMNKESEICQKHTKERALEFDIKNISDKWLNIISNESF